jgi:hypothetical protein
MILDSLDAQKELGRSTISALKQITRTCNPPVMERAAKEIKVRYCFVRNENIAKIE